MFVKVRYMCTEGLEHKSKPKEYVEEVSACVSGEGVRPRRSAPVSARTRSVARRYNLGGEQR